MGVSKFLLTVATVAWLGGFSLVAANSLAKGGSFEKNQEGWSCPDYWPGEFSIVQQGNDAFDGKNYALLKGARAKKGVFGRAYTRYALEKVMTAGHKIKFSLAAKGSGKFRFGAIVYFMKNDSGRGGLRRDMKYINSDETFDLTSEWRIFSAVIDLSQEPAVLTAPLVELVSEGELAFDKISFEYADGAKPTVDLPYVEKPKQAFPEIADTQLITYVGESCPDFTVSGLQPKNEVKVLYMPENFAARVMVMTTDSDGKVKIPGEFYNNSVVGDGKIIVSGSGVATIAVDTLSKEMYDRMDAAAAKARFETPERWLFLADSLTDFRRGGNYVDKMLFFINKHHPGKVQILNAAVRGDFIVRIKQRLKGESGAFNLHMYDHIFDKQPDRIFILLGHNDTHCSQKRNWEPLVPLDEIEENYNQVLAILRERAPKAKITLISNTATNYEFQRAKADKSLARGGKNVYFFGKPEIMSAWNEAIRKIAKDNNFEYVELYEPMLKRSDRKSLFEATDGLHVNNAGNGFIAEQILLQMTK